MNKQDRELLFKDLCSRLPYGVQCQGFYVDDPSCYESYLHKNKIVGCVEGVDHIGYDDGEIYLSVDGYPCELGDVKPYLRSMESMTKEEEREYSKYAHFGNTLGDWTKSIDYLKAHHLDYRGLIPIGLALPAPDGMYNF